MTGSGDTDQRRRAIGRFAATRHADGDWSAPDVEERGALPDVAAFWRNLGHIADDSEIQAMRAEARGRLEQTGAAGNRPRWRLAGISALGASAALAVGLVAFETQRAPTRPSGIAAPAEFVQTLSNGKNLPRTVALSDGSRVTLDADSAIQLVGWRADRRHIVLDRGRAFFTIRHDAAHPFGVGIAGATVTDIGTRFEARLTADGGSVALVDGAVRVEEPGKTAVIMSPGNLLTMRGKAWSVSQTDTDRETAWREGMINVDDRPLAEVVTELNRYLAHPLVLRDPSAGRIRISGVFRLDDPQGLMAALAAIGQSDAVLQTDDMTG